MKQYKKYPKSITAAVVVPTDLDGWDLFDIANTSTDPRALTKLYNFLMDGRAPRSGCNNDSILAALAKNEHTPVAILDKMIDTLNSVIVMEQIASNSTASLEMLLKIASKYPSHAEVLARVACNIHTPKDIRDSIFEHKLTTDDKMRLCWGADWGVPFAVLEYLLDDRDPDVRAAARNGINTASINSSTQVVTAAVNPEPLSDIDYDDALDIARHSTNPNRLAKLENYPAMGVLQALAGNWNTPTNILTNLVGYSDELLNANLARNINCDEATLDRLSNNTSELVRWYVATNPSTSIATLKRLARDSIKDIQIAACKNQSSRA